MLEPIGEPAVRTTTRPDNHLTMDARDASLQKVEKIAEERPIEKSQESAATESDNEEKSSGYDSDDQGIFFEKYDKNGNVVFRVPPEQKPIDERV